MQHEQRCGHTSRPRVPNQQELVMKQFPNCQQETEVTLQPRGQVEILEDHTAGVEISLSWVGPDRKCSKHGFSHNLGEMLLCVLGSLYYLTPHQPRHVVAVDYISPQDQSFALPGIERFFISTTWAGSV